MTEQEPTIHPVLQEKWRQLFAFMDIDNDGKLTIRDYEIIKDRLMNNPNMPRDKREDAVEMMFELWFGHFEANHDDKLTYDDWLKKMTKVMLAGNLPTLVTNLRRRIFHCLDLNNDGFIDFREFQIFAESVGKSDAPYLDKAFDAIDKNKDGFISLEEYLEAYVTYVVDPTVTVRDLPVFGLSLDAAI